MILRRPPTRACRATLVWVFIIRELTQRRVILKPNISWLSPTSTVRASRRMRSRPLSGCARQLTRDMQGPKIAWVCATPRGRVFNKAILRRWAGSVVRRSRAILWRSSTWRSPMLRDAALGPISSRPTRGFASALSKEIRQQQGPWRLSWNRCHSTN